MVPVLASLVLLGPADLTTPPLAGNCGGSQLPYDCQSLTYVSCTPGTGCGCATDTSPTPLLALAPLFLPRRRTAP